MTTLHRLMGMADCRSLGWRMENAKAARSWLPYVFGESCSGFLEPDRNRNYCLGTSSMGSRLPFWVAVCGAAFVAGVVTCGLRARAARARSPRDGSAALVVGMGSVPSS